jgi:hypothetical protein
MAIGIEVMVGGRDVTVEVMVGVDEAGAQATRLAMPNTNNNQTRYLDWFAVIWVIIPD